MPASNSASTPNAVVRCASNRWGVSVAVTCSCNGLMAYSGKILVQGTDLAPKRRRELLGREQRPQVQHRRRLIILQQRQIEHRAR